MKQKIDLSGLDELGIALDEVQKTALTDEMQQLVDVARSTMEEEKIIGSHNLVQSIEPKMVDENSFVVYMDYYWKFINFFVLFRTH